MLRAVLVGLLALSPVACKSSGDSPASQPGVAAGKVVDVSGTVTVRHDNVARPLAKGDTVEGDDVVETGADGNVVIELAHNLARWELGANRSSKVRESAAWGLAKKAGSAAAVEQDSAAAGRHAERSAAETSVSASGERAREAAPAAAAAAPAPAPAAAPAADTSAAPPPPPAAEPPKPTRTATRRSAETADKDGLGSIGTIGKGGGTGQGYGAGVGRLEAKSGGGGGAGGGGAGGDANLTVEREAAPAPAGTAARDLVVRNKKSIQACLTKDMQAVSLRIQIGADGKATVVVKGKTEVPDAVATCVTSAVQKIAFAPAAATVSIEIAR